MARFEAAALRGGGGGDTVFAKQRVREPTQATPPAPRCFAPSESGSPFAHCGVTRRLCRFTTPRSSFLALRKLDPPPFT